MTTMTSISRMSLREVIDAAMAPPTFTGLTYAVGVVRVSEQGDRGTRERKRYTPNEAPRRAQRERRAATTTDRFKTPTEQRDRINFACRNEHLELGPVFEEIDVKGKWPLVRRKGLLKAIQEIEAGRAKVLVVAYFDRLVRSLDVQREILERVEAAGGMVLAVDAGEVATRTAAMWLSSTMLGLVAEYYSRSVGERLGGTQAMSIKDGIMIGTIPVGYVQDPTTRKLVVVPEEAKVMKEAFRMRADGASWTDVRKLLARHGIIRSTGSVCKLLHSKTYLGWVFHGKNVNTEAHEAIVDQATFERVERRKGKSFGTPGKRADYVLLSGLRLLRCGTCGKALTVGQGRGRTLYRCNPNLVCARRTSIEAPIADKFVVEYVRGLLDNVTETESLGWQLVQARVAEEHARDTLNTAVVNLAAVKVASAAQTLAALQEKLDAATDLVAELERRARFQGDAQTLNAGADWDKLTLDEQREIIADVLERVVVAVGGVDADGHRMPRGVSRLTPFKRLSESFR